MEFLICVKCTRVLESNIAISSRIDGLFALKTVLEKWIVYLIASNNESKGISCNRGEGSWQKQDCYGVTFQNKKSAAMRRLCCLKKR